MNNYTLRVRSKSGRLYVIPVRGWRTGPSKLDYLLMGVFVLGLAVWSWL